MKNEDVIPLINYAITETIRLQFMIREDKKLAVWECANEITSLQLVITDLEKIINNIKSGEYD